MGVLDPEVVNLDQREKLTARQLGGVAGISAHGAIISRIAFELLRSNGVGLVGHVCLRSSVGICEE